MNKITKKRYVLWGMGILFCLVFCYPLFSNTLVRGHDTYFHLARIESLKEAYIHGDFFPRLYYEQNFNFGYGTPLFYSDIFLIIPALIRLCGVPIVITYKVFLFMCTGMTFVSMYYTVKKISKNTSSAFLSAVIYLFTAYRITDVYVRGAIGEVLAMIFIPVILLEIYKVLYTDQYNYKYLGLFFALLLLSHNISFVLMCGVFGIFILCNLTRLLKERSRIFCIVKAIFIAIGCLAFFLFPMLEQLSTGKYAVNEFVSDSNLSNYTLFLEQLFTMKINFGLAGHEFGQDYWMTTNTGIIAMILPALQFFRYKEDKANRAFYFLCTLIGYFCLILCLDFFPWSLFNSFLSFMQFPWRLIIVSSALLSLMSGICVIEYFRKIDERRVSLIVLILVLFIGIYQLSFVIKQPAIIFNDTPYSLISDDDYSGEHGIVTYYNQAELAAADYLPIKDNVDYRNYGDYIITNNDVELLDFVRGYNYMSFSISSSEENSLYILPLIYYKGYTIECYDENGNFVESLVPYPDHETFLVSFNTREKNKKMQYVIYYKGTKIQIISYCISLISLLLLLFDKNLKGGLKKLW